MIGIKDFEMPSCCGECQMTSCMGLSGQFYCDITTYDIDMDDTERDADCPLVEAVPKAEVKKFLEEGTKNVSNNVLAIVREDYIHKADYEARLKADMAAMLTEIQLEIEEIEIDVPFGFEPVSKTAAFYDGVSASSKVVQQKIDKLKGKNK